MYITFDHIIGSVAGKCSLLPGTGGIRLSIGIAPEEPQLQQEPGDMGYIKRRHSTFMALTGSIYRRTIEPPSDSAFCAHSIPTCTSRFISMYHFDSKNEMFSLPRFPTFIATALQLPYTQRSPPLKQLRISCSHNPHNHHVQPWQQQRQR